MITLLNLKFTLMTTNTTPNGTNDLRLAALRLLEDCRNKLEGLEARSKRCREEKEKPLKVEEWIIISWELEAQLLKDSIETIEK